MVVVAKAAEVRMAMARAVALGMAMQAVATVAAVETASQAVAAVAART